MSAAALKPSARRAQAGTTEPAWVRYTLIGVALTFMFLFLVLPLAAVFTEALRKGLGAYIEALKEPDAWSAIRLTLVTAAVAVAPPSQPMRRLPLGRSSKAILIRRLSGVTKMAMAS